MANTSCETNNSNDRLTDLPDNRIITVQGLRKKYASEPYSGISKANLFIEKGKIVAIVGESGSGKSTLLKLIYGLISPDEGRIYFRNEPIMPPEKKLIPGHDSMKMVTQDFSLNIYAKAYDNVASMLSNTNLKLKSEKTIKTLNLLGIGHLAERRVIDLSGGEQQRVAIAKAIITEPEVLLMDEPFSQVDTLLKSQLRADIRRLAYELGITIILVSHDPVDGLSLADELIILKRGEVVETGTPKQLYNQPKNIYTARLLADCNVLSSQDAHKLGINTKSSSVAIYLDQVQLKPGERSITFTLCDAFFKGICEELLLEKEGVKLRALNFDMGFYKIGELIPVSIESFKEFN
ncbi:ABC transporter ATP-binding protein [Desertivirga xinjiangensis]|uniref:ABC transporter ATP-binding protein n=1 Tax=Desertivirga xinjiangensis TaxID=539206 RepID=UPI0021099B4C|nr:ABC transporter ATP-binding protein [Pedobacter xinjiangensis]